MDDRGPDESRMREVRTAIAEALELDSADLGRLEFWIDPQLSDDGTIMGFNIYFGEASDPAILNRIAGLMDGRWVSIGATVLR